MWFLILQNKIKGTILIQLILFMYFIVKHIPRWNKAICLLSQKQKNQFDVDLTGKMTEFDQIMHRFGILSKNAIQQGVECHDSLILGDFSIFAREKPFWRRFDR